MSNLRVESDLDLGGRHLVICSNREPYKVRPTDSGYEFEATKGGLASALLPVMRSSGGLWISWGGGTDSNKHRLPDRQEVPDEEPRLTQRRVFLTPEQVDGFYYGFSNQALWPRCHSFIGRCHFLPHHWQAYLEVNARYAAAIADEVDKQHDLVWVQDYHMALVGAHLRSIRPELVSGIFWNIPFPPPDLFRYLPWKREILEGLPATDVVGFHTRQYSTNFARCAAEVLGAEWDPEGEDRYASRAHGLGDRSRDRRELRLLQLVRLSGGCIAAGTGDQGAASGRRDTPWR